MGQMRFITPRREQLLEGAVQQAYLAGMDEIPARSHNRLEDDTLVIERSVGESAHLTILWPVEQYGHVALRTASLIERPRPYILPVELARGTLSRLRDRVSDGQLDGLTLPDGFESDLREAARLFFRAATSQNAPPQAADLAGRSLSLALPAMDRLATHFAQQSLVRRHGTEARFAALFGARIAGPPLDDPQSTEFVAAFNAVVAPTSWPTIEAHEDQWDWRRTDDQFAWCAHQGLRVCAGPLLQFDAADIPDWLHFWNDDFPVLLERVCRYVRQVVQHCQDHVHAWLGVSRLGGHCPLNLSDEQKLRLAVSVIEVIRCHDPQKPIVLSFDQPWAEYMAREDQLLSPLHFADAIVRADLGVAGLALELDCDFSGGSLPRDILQIERHIQHWSELGLPLLVLLTTPSSSADDPRASRHARDKGAATPGGHSPQTQTDYARRLIPLLLANPAVQGLIWNETRDAIPHEFAHGGVFDADGRAKPVLEALAEIRRDHLV